MSDRRPRLTDEDIDLIVAALSARLAMSGAKRRHQIERLIARLAENVRGNPQWILGYDGQRHEHDERDGECWLSGARG